MINKNKSLVVDLDGCICKLKKPEQDYCEIEPNEGFIAKLREYQKDGFQIIIFTSRNMNTFDGNIGKINAITLKAILAWLDKHHVPYDEIHVGKPWGGKKGFYIDDKAIRPDEFVSKTLSEIYKLIDCTEYE